MNYEKKSKEALEKARIYRDNAKAVEEYAAAARYENIFPQLRESEDERMAEMAIKAVLSPEAQSCIKSWGVSPDDVIAWLEKQKEQKPAEWSEEDEKAIEEICNIIVANSKYGYLGRYYAPELVEKLKSLRPHWKPSEGQIQALEYVVSSIPPNYLKEQEYVMTLIGQVIQQLKKLLYGSTR